MISLSDVHTAQDALDYMDQAFANNTPLTTADFRELISHISVEVTDANGVGGVYGI